MKLNMAFEYPKITTHEGARAVPITREQQLRRLVLSCLLWEDEFYVDGYAIADHVRATVPLVDPKIAAEIAIEAREKQNLRHVPLLIARVMAALPEHKGLVANLLERIIQRPDELAEFLMIYDGDFSRGFPTLKPKSKLSAQVKKGLARAFAKFNEYQIAKYNRETGVRLKDVLFLSHAKPKTGIRGWNAKARKAGMAAPEDASSRLFQKLVKDELTVPDTWEVALSAGADKKATFERLISEKKLGALALLRNLRNMHEAGVEQAFVAAALLSANYSRVLPFRFIAAARAVPSWEPAIEVPMLARAAQLPKWAGKTAVLVDVSGSMNSEISKKSDMTRMDAACAVAVLAREVSEDCAIWAFSDAAHVVPPRRGFALRDAIVSACRHSATMTAAAIEAANAEGYDRLIIVTDEQSHTAYPDPLPEAKAYAINVASNQNGLGYGRWVHIDGWSEAVLNFISEYEAAL